MNQTIAVDLTPIVRFFEQLPRSGDMELAVLKTHLLIEELLTKILTDAALNASGIEKANLRFTQKMQLARAFGGLADQGWLWESIAGLNATRNKLAHILSVAEIERHCGLFIALVEKSQGTPDNEVLSPVFGRFHWAAFKVFSALAAFAHVDSTGLHIPSPSVPKTA